MNNIQTFTNNLFGNVTVLLDINGDPWFVGNEIATILGYSRPRDAIHDHVYEEDKGSAKLTLPRGGTQDTTIINESGLYSLIFGSKLPAARQFKHWVTSEVLPTMRKLGFNESLQLMRDKIDYLNNQLSIAGSINVSNSINNTEKKFLESWIINNPKISLEDKIEAFRYDPTEYNPEYDLDLDINKFKNQFGLL